MNRSSLMVEIAGNVESAADESAALPVERPGVLAVAVGVAAESLFEKCRGLVAEHADLAGQRQPLPRRPLRQIVAARPVRVILDGLALQMIQGQPHGRQGRHRR